PIRNGAGRPQPRHQRTRRNAKWRIIDDRDEVRRTAITPARERVACRTVRAAHCDGQWEGNDRRSEAPRFRTVLYDQTDRPGNRTGTEPSLRLCPTIRGHNSAHQPGRKGHQRRDLVTRREEELTDTSSIV